MQGTVKGGRRQDRQRNRWEDNIRPGVCQVPEGSREQGKMEETGCEIICGAQRIDDDDDDDDGDDNNNKNNNIMHDHKNNDDYVRSNIYHFTAPRVFEIRLLTNKHK